ncbi:MAG: replication-associated recombination protein A [Pseudobdellovibrionaceae bacterium]|nr:replication-associated recombination protein A [Bdellovibrionales bacterium]USN47456.1 MAG: replication-associated recombination protein A [Pseudobdellovibrionaceae bacterium]
MDLFEQAQNQYEDSTQPLAEQLRPKDFEDFVGQAHALGPGTALRKNIETGWIQNLILWGPPGSGKTTFAHLLAEKIDSEFVTVNAVDTGAKKLRELGQQARDRRLQFRRKTMLFIDEIHRLNKAQQDVLLPFAEKGDFVLVGATTENPSYELNSALLSRCRLVVFRPHTREDLARLMKRAAERLSVPLDELLTSEAQEDLCERASGDARRLINWFEQIASVAQLKAEGINWPVGRDQLSQVIETAGISYDKNSDEHYNCVSAFIKSVRGSDPDAALYYLARMLRGGEDPVFIARRLVILASEDIGNADPRAITVAVSGLQAVELIGMPEARISLAQVTTYLSSAPKSNRAYVGLEKAFKVVDKTGALPIPLALRSSRTQAMRDLGYGKDYVYTHDAPKGWARQQYLPESVKAEKFYEPVDRGFEKTILQYLAWLRE